MRYYLTKNEAEFAEFVRNLKYQINENADYLNLDPEEVQKMTVLLENFQTDSRAQVDAKAAYKSATTRKEASKKNVKSAVKKFVRSLKSNGRTTDAQLRLLKLPIQDEVLTPLKMPESVPILLIGIKQRGVHIIEIRNSENMARAKPETTTGAEIWCYIGDKEDLNENNMRYLGLATRSKFKVEHDSEDAGKTAHYMARWINRRGVRGDWNNTNSATIAE